MMTFINVRSPPYKRAKSSGPSSSDAFRLMIGSTSTTPRASRSMHSGISPLDAHDPRTDISRLTTSCSGNSTLGDRLPTRMTVPPLRRQRIALAHRVAVADHLEGDVRASAARDIADGCRDVTFVRIHRVRGSQALRERQLLWVYVDGNDVPAACGFEYLNQQHADHSRANDHDTCHQASAHDDSLRVRQLTPLRGARRARTAGCRAAYRECATARRHIRRMRRDDGSRRTRRRAPCGCHTG